MMFQSEMENLELGLNLRSSDLLFPDDLLNIPLDNQTTTTISTGLEIQSGNIFGDDIQADIDDCKMDASDVQDDILARIIEEVKLPHEMETTSGDVSFWPVNDDISFETTTNVGPVSPTSSQSSEDSTQTLIDEMEEFLVSHEKNINMNQQDDDIKTVMTQNMETEQAEEILDALMNGNISLNDSGYSSEINNISEVNTANGNVIIVITNDTDNGGGLEKPPQSVSPSLSTLSYAPSPSSSYIDNGSDSDWTPSSPTLNTQKNKRETKKRGPYKRSKPYNIKDKKERKKMQNVVAARRYRDKKKNEQVFVEEEVDQLEKKNKALKSTVSEMEGELKTLKKLMLELGLVKINQKKQLVTV